MKWKRMGQLAVAATLCLGFLAGCFGEKTTEVVTEPGISLRNDGREAAIVLGELELSQERTAVLEEIAAKYQADFPQTKISIRSYSSAEELEKALQAGELDIAEVSSGTQRGYVQKGLLLDLYPYGKVWEESPTLTPAAQQAMSSLGAERAYLIPNGFTQDLLYYRSDWANEYNEGLEKDLARFRIWDEISGGPVAGEMLTGASEKLGERGKLAFAGKERLVDYFDTMVWGSISLARVADSSAAYFSAADESRSIFSLEKAEEGIDQFLRVMENSALPEALDWTEEQALEAFLDGRAGILLADRSAMDTLRHSMPEDSWDVMAFPRGRMGAAVFADEFSGWAVSASTVDPEITVHFLTFLSNADNNTHYAKVCGVLPIHIEAADLEESLTEGDLAIEMEMIRRTDWYQYASEPIMYQAYEGYREQANEKLRQFARGELSKEELTNFLDSYWNKAYEEEGKRW